MENTMYGYCYDTLCKKVINGLIPFKNSPNISTKKAIQDLEKRKMELRAIINRNDFPEKTPFLLSSLDDISLSKTQFDFNLDKVMSNGIKELFIFKYEQIESIGKSLINDYNYLFNKELDELEHKKKNEDTLPNLLPSTNNNSKLDKKKIFIVHGQNIGMKESIARFLEKTPFEPIILSEQANSGRTIIEKFEQNAKDIGLAIILFSPDDEHTEGGFHARPNVLFELGYFIGNLGRGNVIILNNHTKEDVVIPSDLFGVVYISYIDNNSGWKYDLAREMNSLNYSIDLNKI